MSALRTTALRIGAGLSTEPFAEVAVRAASREARAALGDEPVDLAVLFITPDHAPFAQRIAEVLHRELAPVALIGCSANGVIGGSREIEGPSAVGVWAARLPGATLQTFAATLEQTPEGSAFAGFPGDLPQGASVVMLADPYTFPVDALLERLNEDRPELVVTGGLASGGASRGAHRLFRDGEVLNGGAVGVVVGGSVRVRTLVSQGCRPVGSPAVVTKADGNMILELAGAPPLERLRETFGTASPEDRELMRKGVHIGVVIDEYKSDFGRGDFLIRNVMGADPEAGAVAVGDVIDVGSTVQFHVRDAASADEDLRLILQSVEAPPAGALLFSCNGRGTHMFAQPDHDAQAVQSRFGGVPLAGFFCGGEIGPVGGRNFLHGFTASIALFEQAG